LEEYRVGKFGDRVADGLGDVPHVRGPYADHLRADALARARTFAVGEASP
jgi:hypothetical protein